MNQICKQIGISALMGLVVPTVLLGVILWIGGRIPDEPLPTVPQKQQNTESTEPVWIPVLAEDGTVQQMDLNEYLTGVLLAEMPASFEQEAKKAQAVVARTYAIRCDERRTKHDLAAVCMDSSCCQGYTSAEDYLSKGGTQDDVDAAASAVYQTGMMVLTYEDALIEATYFSCSGGRTEDAVAVWGTDVPYLRATDSPGEENAAHYCDTVTFSQEEFAQALSLELEGDPGSWLGPVTYTAGGGVNTMMIGGISFDGTALRKALDLRSTAFSMTVDGNSISVTTRGFGHRVGMSQYGADAMAVSGCSYEQILAHYYQNTVLESWIDKRESMG